MFRRILIYLLPGFLLLSSFKHPYHLSVTILKFTRAEKILKVEIKMFYHDLEPAVNVFGHTEIDIKHHDDKQKRDSLLYAYTDQRFRIVLDGKQLPLEKQRITFVDKYAVIQLQCSNVSGQKLSVSNTMCFETESAQTNIFHLIGNGKKITRQTVNPKSEANFELPQ